MAYYPLLSIILWLSMAQLYAAVRFNFVVEQFEEESQGFRFSVAKSDTDKHILNIKCANYDITRLPPNYVEIKADGKMYTSDRCTREFCPHTAAPPKSMDFRMVTWREWQNGLNFTLGLSSGMNFKLRIVRKPLFGNGVFPGFLHSRKARDVRNVHFMINGEVILAKTYNLETMDRLVNVSNYDPWVVLAAKHALEQHYIRVPPSNNYFGRLTTLFYFADDYNFIIIQKLILALQFSTLTNKNLPDVLAFVLSLKKDRFGLLQRSIDTLAAYYCNHMETIELSFVLKDTELSLSCMKLMEQ